MTEENDPRFVTRHHGIGGQQINEVDEKKETMSSSQRRVAASNSELDDVEKQPLHGVRT